jgi:hypothetical protein
MHCCGKIATSVATHEKGNLQHAGLINGNPISRMM